MASILQPQMVPHPGDYVAEYLDFNGWSQRDLARRTGLTPKTISEICNGKAPISATTALALEKVFGRPAHFWLNLQRHYEEAQARVREVERSSQWGDWAQKFPLKEMKRWNDWARKFPLKEMKRFRFLEGTAGASDLDVLLSFLGVSSPQSWESVWQSAQIAYRQTQRFTMSAEAV